MSERDPRFRNIQESRSEKRPRVEVESYLEYLKQVDLMTDIPTNPVISLKYLDALVLNYDIIPEDRKLILSVAKHPDILSQFKSERMREEPPERVSNFSDSISSENEDLLKQPMSEQELRDFFLAFVQLLKNKKTAAGATFVMGKHHEFCKKEAAHQVFPNAERYKQKVRTFLKGKDPKGNNSILNGSSGEATYVDESLGEKQLRFFQTLAPEEIEYFFDSGNINTFAYRGIGVSRSDNYPLEYIEKLSAVVKESPLAMAMHFQDTYFRTMIPKIDSHRGLFLEVKYRPYKCFKFDMVKARGNGIEHMKRAVDLHMLTILGPTENIYKSIQKPDDEEKNTGRYDDYFQLVRAMRTNPAFLVEALHEAFPDSFVGDFRTKETYYDPEKNKSDSIPMRLYNQGATQEFPKSIGGKYTPGKHSKWRTSVTENVR